MITKLQLQNFQSHRDTTLDLAPGVNVLVGRSDSGKTAVIRALEWVTWNRPAGEAFRSRWGGGTAVRVVTEEGSVEREKGGQNRYVLGEGVAREGLLAMGQSVPEPVTALLQLGAENFQDQMDAPFLLSQSSGEVARRLNEVVNLEVIDKALAAVQALQRQTAAQVRECEERHLQLLEELAVLSYLPVMGKDVAHLEDIQEAMGLMERKAGRLKTLLDLLPALDLLLTRAGPLAEARGELMRLEAVRSQLMAAQDKHRDLSVLLRSIAQMTEGIEELREATRKTKERLAAIKVELCPTCGQPWPKEAR